MKTGITGMLGATILIISAAGTNHAGAEAGNKKEEVGILAENKTDETGAEAGGGKTKFSIVSENMADEDGAERSKKEKISEKMTVMMPTEAQAESGAAQTEAAGSRMTDGQLFSAEKLQGEIKKTIPVETEPEIIMTIPVLTGEYPEKVPEKTKPPVSTLPAETSVPPETAPAATQPPVQTPAPTTVPPAVLLYPVSPTQETQLTEQSSEEVTEAAGSKVTVPFEIMLQYESPVNAVPVHLWLPAAHQRVDVYCNLPAAEGFLYVGSTETDEYGKANAVLDRDIIYYICPGGSAGREEPENAPERSLAVFRTDGSANYYVQREGRLYRAVKQKSNSDPVEMPDITLQQACLFFRSEDPACEDEGELEKGQIPEKTSAPEGSERSIEKEEASVPETSESGKTPEESEIGIEAEEASAPEGSENSQIPEETFASEGLESSPKPEEVSASEEPENGPKPEEASASEESKKNAEQNEASDQEERQGSIKAGEMVFDAVILLFGLLGCGLLSLGFYLMLRRS